MWITMDEMLTWRPEQDVAKPYPPKPVPLQLGDSVKRGRESSKH
jgi:NADH-quinone oxidoreductase subunit I